MRTLYEGRNSRGGGVSVNTGSDFHLRRVYRSTREVAAGSKATPNNKSTIRRTGHVPGRAGYHLDWPAMAFQGNRRRNSPSSIRLSENAPRPPQPQQISRISGMKETDHPSARLTLTNSQGSLGWGRVFESAIPKNLKQWLPT